MRGSVTVQCAGHLGPRPDADAIGLRDAAVARQRLGRRLGIGPHALLEGAPQLGLVRGANDVVALVLEGRIEEEAVVLDLEVLALFADAALAQGDELFALGEGTDGDRPFLESNWHKKGREGGTKRETSRAADETPSWCSGYRPFSQSSSRKPK